MHLSVIWHFWHHFNQNHLKSISNWFWTSEKTGLDLCPSVALETLKQKSAVPSPYTFTSIFILLWLFFVVVSIWCHDATSVVQRDALCHLGTRLTEVFFLQIEAFGMHAGSFLSSMMTNGWCLWRGQRGGVGGEGEAGGGRRGGGGNIVCFFFMLNQIR